jgi:hypothetical protein
MSTARSYIKGRVRDEHVEIAERVIGRRLPIGAQVHHIDGDKKNNALNNLLICPSAAYHKLLHSRERALDHCGNANWFKCNRCHKWDSPENLYIGNRYAYHRECRNETQREYRWRKGICLPR